MRTRAVAYILMLAVAVPGLSLARELASEKYNCAVDVPDGDAWESFSMPSPVFVFGVRHTGDGRTFGLIAVPLPVPVDTVTTSMKTGLEEGFLREGPAKAGFKVSKLYSRDISIRDRPAYEIAALAELPNGKMLLVNRAVVAGGYQYGFNASTPKDKLENDPEMSAILSSFRFLKTPTPQSAANTAWNTHEISKLCGGIGALLLVVMLVVHLARRSGKKAGA